MEKKTRNEIIKVRVSEDEKQKIRDRAQRCNMDISSYLRQRGIHDEPVREDEQMAKVMEYLYRVASVMNGMGHMNTEYQEAFKKFHKEAMGIYGSIQADIERVL